MVEAFVADANLSSWVTVTPHFIIRDICEMAKFIWTLNFHDLFFIAVRAAVFNITGTGKEACILTLYYENAIHAKQVFGNWLTIIYKL